MVLTVSFALSLVIGLSCHHTRCDALASSPVTPASRRQDHTTSPSAFENAFVFRIESVHRIPRPTFVTIAKRPSVRGRGTARFMDVIWAIREGKYFCSNGWTASISLIGFEKFAVWCGVICGSKPSFESPLTTDRSRA
jgi:hypothetical protein